MPTYSLCTLKVQEKARNLMIEDIRIKNTVKESDFLSCRTQYALSPARFGLPYGAVLGSKTVLRTEQYDSTDFDLVYFI